MGNIAIAWTLMRAWEYALSYYARYSSLEKIDYLLNKNPSELSIHCWLYPVRASLVLIAAKLTDNTRYSVLENIYTEELEEAAELYKSSFIQIKSYLSI